MAAHKGIAVGVDIGGTHLRVGVVRGDQVLFLEKLRVWSSSAGPEEMMDLVADEIRTVVGRAGLNPDDIDGVGLGLPGLVDHRTGHVVWAVNLPWAKGVVNIKHMLEKRLDLPVLVDHDVAVAGIGEYMFGGHGNASHFLYVTMGTGIASCYIANGKLLRGAHNFASEAGHTCIDLDGPECACGMKGCLEAMAAGPAIAREAGMSAEEAVEKARQGHPTVLMALEKTVGHLAVGFLNLMSVLDPDVVVIGGGLSEVSDVVVEPLKERIRKLSTFPFTDDIQIRTATFGDNSGIIGAAAQFGDKYAGLG